MFLEGRTMSTAHYDVFVSYSHRNAAFADRLSRRIRTYRPPRATGLGRRRLVVFRDRERLTTSADLTKTLADTVGSAEHLVLLASPESAQSPYVDKELAAFLDHRGESHLSIVLCDGEFGDSLSPALRARVREPLYIDMRQPGRRTFRLESLRLIAALLGVNYAELRREDDERRRRYQAFAVTGAMLLAFAIGSGYLVSTTPAEAWEQVLQPETQAAQDPLMPVERVAISPTDPSVVVWLGENARYARDLAGVQRTWSLDAIEDFESRAKAAVAAEPDPDSAVRRVATVSLEATNGNDSIGSGELRVYAFLERGRLRFCRTFRFSAAAPPRRNVTLPLTTVEDGRGPFDLEPWAADALRTAGFDTLAMEIRGTFSDHTRAVDAMPVEFNRSDNAGDIREVLDATAGPEHVVFSTSDRVGEELKQRLDELGDHDLWSQMVTAPEWAVYHAPQHAKSLTITPDSGDLRADARASGLDADLARMLDPAITKGDFVNVEQVSRSAGNATVSVATITGVFDHHEIVAGERPTHYLRRPGGWVKIALPLETTAARVVDVVPGDPGLQTLWIVSDREGVFRSDDGGTSWRGANLGESRLRNGERVRLIVAGSTVFALAAIRTEPGDDPNPLFLLAQRGWVRRWRLGLAGLLAADGST